MANLHFVVDFFLNNLKLYFSFEDDIFENSDEIDDIINYQDGLEDFDHVEEEEVDLVVKRANPFDNANPCECLPLVESFQLTNLNDLSEQENQAKNNLKDVVHHHHDENLNSSNTIYDENNNASNNVQNEENKDTNDERGNEIEEEIKSISSIEGSLKGLSSHSNYEVLSGLSSSTPLHLYPKIGK